MVSRLLVKPAIYKITKSSNEPTGLIQGQEPDSVEEWRVAQALGRIKVPFIYQFEIFDASVRGGIILDFLVQTNPLATPLEVDGQYWHRGERSSKDIMRQVTLERYFLGKTQPLVVLYGKDLASPELADSAVRKAILNV